MPNDDVTRILSIDGGGIRGIIPAMVLEEIERCTGKPVAELFDVVAGTSTGGIIALGLACPAPQYSAAELVNFYVQDGPKVFAHECLGRLRQLFWPKYGVKELEAVLHRYFGEVRLREARVDVLVPAYDVERRQVIFFRSAHAVQNPDDYDYPMRLVARATSAAPTYFKPLLLRTSGPDRHYALIDGGVAVNDPGLAAYVDAWAGQAAQPENVMIVSLGTGSQQTAYTYAKVKGWGLLGWARPVLNIALDAGPEVTEYQLLQVLGPNYYRFQTDLPNSADALDNSTTANIDELRELGRKLIATKRVELDEICQRLVRPRTQKPVPPAGPGIRAAGRPLARQPPPAS